MFLKRELTGPMAGQVRLVTAVPQWDGVVLHEGCADHFLKLYLYLFNIWLWVKVKLVLESTY